MIDQERLNRRVAILQKLLRAKVGARGKTLQAGLDRAGRRLPRHVQAAGRLIADAQLRAQNPRLAVTADARQIDLAFDQVTAHLKGLDPWDRRKGVILGVLGGLAFNLLVAGALLAAFLFWRGHL